MQSASRIRGGKLPQLIRISRLLLLRNCNYTGATDLFLVFFEILSSGHFEKLNSLEHNYAGIENVPNTARFCGGLGPWRPRR
jgi:hypothetical protein